MLRASQDLRASGLTEEQASAIARAIHGATSDEKLATQADILELKTEIKRVETVLSTEIKPIEYKFDAKFEAIDTRFDSLEAKLTYRIVGLMTAVMSLLYALDKFIL